MDLGIAGRVAFVAGGTGGLGLAVGRALAAEGAAVALAGRRGAVAKQEASGFARGAGVEMDLLDVGSIHRAVTFVEAELGPIDILILNSGGPPASTASTVDIKAVRLAGELLLYGPLELAKSCLTSMRSRGWGRIVALGSSAVPQPNPILPTSSMFRVALASFLKLLAEEVAHDGVTVNVVHPGRIATERLTRLDQVRASQEGTTPEVVQASSVATIPLGRYGTPEEFAAMVTFLCGEGARYVTGEQIRVDGGLIRAL